MLTIISWGLVLKIVMQLLGIRHTWVVFFANIFFYITGAEFKNIKAVLISGVLGILVSILRDPLIEWTGPFLGEVVATVLPMTIITGCMSLMKASMPTILCGALFPYLIVGCIYIHHEDVMDIITCLATLLIGGTITMMVGAYIVNRSRGTLPNWIPKWMWKKSQRLAAQAIVQSEEEQEKDALMRQVMEETFPSAEKIEQRLLYSEPERIFFEIGQDDDE